MGHALAADEIQNPTTCSSARGGMKSHNGLSGGGLGPCNPASLAEWTRCQKALTARTQSALPSEPMYQVEPSKSKPSGRPPPSSEELQ